MPQRTEETENNTLFIWFTYLVCCQWANLACAAGRFFGVIFVFDGLHARLTTEENNWVRGQGGEITSLCPLPTNQKKSLAV